MNAQSRTRPRTLRALRLVAELRGVAAQAALGEAITRTQAIELGIARIDDELAALTAEVARWQAFTATQSAGAAQRRETQLARLRESRARVDARRRDEQRRLTAARAATEIERQAVGDALVQRQAVNSLEAALKRQLARQTDRRAQSASDDGITIRARALHRRR